MAEKGFLIDADEPQAKIAIDRAEFSLDWDAERQALAMPFQIVSGGNRITLLAQVDAPRERGSDLGRGGDRRHGGAGLGRARRSQPAHSQSLPDAAAGRPRQAADRREQGDIGNMEVGLAVSGNLDYSTADPRLALGVAGQPHVGGRDEEAVAVLHHPEGARLGR